MDERWRKIESLYHSALEIDRAQRGDFLAAACAGDENLRREVESLLARQVSTDALTVPGAWAAVERMTVTRTIMTVGAKIGPYEILGPLGAGGMGEVYRARDSKLGREVAIKTLPSEFARDPQRLARFRREARTLASLNHPNIGAIYGLEESEDVDCLVLELVEGENLKGPLPIPVALDRAAQVADALEAAHAKGIVHRDLKPANVKVTPAGKVKVLDFGLAKAIWGQEGNQDLSHVSAVTGAESIAGQILGTPGYMSPEQARGQEVDKRTDIWAFGCLLYELLAGKRAFQGETLQDTIAAVLEREPDWSALPAKTPPKIRELLRACLQKDLTRRPADITDAVRVLRDAQRGWNRWALVAAVAATFAALAVGGALWFRNPPPRPTDQSQWVQITKFSDSVTQPTLSPDGKMLAFLRGDSTFIGPSEVYVKILPDGEPVQLTRDNTVKMSPAFSPDGSRIAYTTVAPDFSWDTWTIPTLGGQPQPMLKNASGLTWTGSRRVMFSEIKMGVHMGIDTAEESRLNQRGIYLPGDQPSMAHRSYLSPDGKSVLLVEMNADHLWEPCRVVPADGSSAGHKVGPLGGGCTVAAWSPDGKWMYFTSNAIADNHIWRQRFPNGKPEQITAGPTEEEGLAITPDGRSLITAVALQNAALWVHDARGERQVSLEGNAADPRFTPDGKKLLYRVVKEPPSEFGYFKDAGEIRVADLDYDRSDPLAPGLQTLYCSLSPDGRQVVMEIEDAQGKPGLWLAPLDRSSPPRQIPNAEGRAPVFGPDGDVFFRHVEGKPGMMGNTGYVYRVHPDGSGLRKAVEPTALLFGFISPDGQWLVGWGPLPGDGPPAVQAWPVNGGPPLNIAGTMYTSWSGDRRSLFMYSNTIGIGKTYVIPLRPGESFPPIPKGGFTSEEELARLPGAKRIDAVAVPGPSSDIYAFYRGATQRNLYRIPLP
jgi:eukaryotic-like serine/threonine-protein kinase